MNKVFWGNYGLGLVYQIDSISFVGLVLLLYLTAGFIAWRFPQFSLLKYRFVKIFAVVTLFIFTMFASSLAHDEAEHIHATWLMSQGMLPFRDFWEHHSPALWLMLAPLYKILPAGLLILDVTRVIMALVALATLWVLLAGARLMKFSTAGNYWLVFFWLLAAPLGHIWQLRPDPFGNLLALLALGSLCYGSSWRPATISGVLVGLTLAMSPKHFIVCMVPAIILLFSNRPVRSLLVHALGVALGLLPLILWLQAHELGADFIKWVLLYNSNDKGRLCGMLVPLVSFIAIMGWCASRPSFTWKGMTLPERVLLLSILASLATVFFQPAIKYKFQYHLQMLFILQPLLAAVAINWWLSIISNVRWRAVFMTLLVLVGLTPVMRDYFIEYRIGYNFQNTKKVVATMIKLAGDEPVFSIMPVHPLFAFDAVDMFNQYPLENLGNPAVKPLFINIAKDLERKKPPIIYCGGNEFALPDYFKVAGIFDLRGEVDFIDFLHANYTLYMPFRSAGVWVRKDRMVYVEK